jgi:hypothetical protein
VAAPQPHLERLLALSAQLEELMTPHLPASASYLPGPGDDGVDQLADELTAKLSVESTDAAESTSVVDARLAEKLAELDAFVARHADLRQRTPEWYARMAKTVGGSDIAAVLGLNPYSSARKVVDAKAEALQGRDAWFGGSSATRWGVLFEDVAAAVVAADFGSPVRGDEVCICAVPGHRYSPDGYIVGRGWAPGAEAAAAAAGAARRPLWTTAAPAAAAGRPRVVLIEIKCPYSRQPAGRVPPQYAPQLWSGLDPAVSPLAEAGLFVDCAFRKAPWAALGPGPGYDTAYHARDRGAFAGAAPYAWGLVLVFAPALDAPRSARLGWAGPVWAPGDPAGVGPDADAAHAAATLAPPEPALAAFGALADYGALGAAGFDRLLALLDAGRLLPCRLAPQFADGRFGGPPPAPADLLAAALAAARANPGMCPADSRGEAGWAGASWAAPGPALRALPPHFVPVGVIGWKLFEPDYLPVERRPGFLADAGPAIDAVHAAAVERVEALAREAAERATRKAPIPSLEDIEASAQAFDDFMAAGV